MSHVPAAAPTRMGREEASAVRAAIAGVVETGPWIGGPAVEEFESAFGAASGIPHVVGTGNGTDALAIAMAAMQLPPGSQVLVAGNDGGYSSIAARSVGLVPVVMDVDVESMAPTVETAEAVWDSRVSAIVITHLHGDPVELAGLDAWRRGRGIRLIEDCAQAHGAIRRGVRVGTTGDAATFSFYPTKNLGAIGDAGAVGFVDEHAAHRARRLAQYGWGERYRVESARGRNSRLDPIQAAVLRARLPWLAARNERRRGISNRYRDALEGRVIGLAGDRVDTVAHHAVLIAHDRDRVAGRLRAAGIALDIHYPTLVQEMPGLDIAATVTPNAALLRDRILSLPCFPEMTDAEVDQVVNVLAADRELS